MRWMLGPFELAGGWGRRGLRLRGAFISRNIPPIELLRLRRGVRVIRGEAGRS